MRTVANKLTTEMAGLAEHAGCCRLQGRGLELPRCSVRVRPADVEQIALLSTSTLIAKVLQNKIRKIVNLRE